MTKQTFRKELSRKIEGNREFVEYEYYSLEDFITVDELQVICDIHGDDAEAAYSYGVAFDMDDDLSYIDIANFLDWATDYMLDQEEDDDEHEKDPDYDTIKKVKEKLEKYRGFDVWF